MCVSTYTLLTRRPRAQAHVRNSACALLLALSEDGESRKGDERKTGLAVACAPRLVDVILSQDGYIEHNRAQEELIGGAERTGKEIGGVPAGDEKMYRVCRALVGAARVAPVPVLKRTLTVLQSEATPLQSMRVVCKMLSSLGSDARVAFLTGDLAARYLRFVFAGCKVIRSPAGESGSEQEALVKSCVLALADILTDTNGIGAAPRDAFARVLDEAQSVLTAAGDEDVGEHEDGVAQDVDEVQRAGEASWDGQVDWWLSRELKTKMGVLTVSTLLNRSAELGILVRPRVEMLVRGLMQQVGGLRHCGAGRGGIDAETQQMHACVHPVRSYAPSGGSVCVQTDTNFVLHVVSVSQTVMTAAKDSRKLGMQTLLALLSLCPQHPSEGSSEVSGEEDRFADEAGADVRDLAVEELVSSVAKIKGMQNSASQQLGSSGQAVRVASRAEEIADECIKPLLPLLASPMAGEHACADASANSCRGGGGVGGH